VPEARRILADQFSEEHAEDPLSFVGLTYACVTRSDSSDMREVAVFGRDDGGGLRLYIAGEAAAVRLQDAINRLIHEAQEAKAAGVRVEGLVRTPGAMACHEGMTVAEAIEKAGGLIRPEATIRLRLIRRVQGDTVRRDVELTHVVEAGDTIDVSERPRRDP
jgi:hypothetical protein